MLVQWTKSAILRIRYLLVVGVIEMEINKNIQDILNALNSDVWNLMPPTSLMVPTNSVNLQKVRKYLNFFIKAFAFGINIFERNNLKF